MRQGACHVRGDRGIAIRWDKKQRIVKERERVVLQLRATGVKHLDKEDTGHKWDV